MSSLNIVIECGWNCDQADFIWLHYVLIVAFFLLIFYSIYFSRRYFSSKHQNTPKKAKTETLSGHSDSASIHSSPMGEHSSTGEKCRKPIKKSTKYLLESIASVVMSGLIVAEGISERTGNGIFILILTFVDYKIVASFFLLLAYIFIKLYFDTRATEQYD